MPDKISILKESGETLSSNVVSVFMIPDTEKKYIITTENAVDPHGLTVLHVSEIDNGTLQRVATDEEWSSIKTIMRAIISGNVGSYQYLPTIENINASGQYSRDISVSASASKQMIDNYVAGDKNATTTQPAGTGTPDVIAPSNEALQEPEPALQQQPNSIFPAGGISVNNEDELIPGISEVSTNTNVSVSPQTVQPVTQEPVALQPQTVTPQVVPTQTAPVEQNIPTGQPVNDQQMGINTLTNNVQDPSIMMVTQPIPVQNVLQPDVATMDSANVGIQVVGPTQTVPTGQIVQEAQSPLTNDIKFDTNVVPSFNPNATLDEVVIGAQEMFMEGVKNLVQTIQEKVYRDLYNKEAELKMRETALEQREQLLNSQMMAMMSNFGNQQMINTMSQVPIQQPVQQVQMGVPPVSTVQTTTPVQSVIPTNVTGPTVVSAANDVI